MGENENDFRGYYKLLDATFYHIRIYITPSSLETIIDKVSWGNEIFMGVMFREVHVNIKIVDGNNLRIYGWTANITIWEPRIALVFDWIYLFPFTYHFVDLHRRSPRLYQAEQLAQSLLRKGLVSVNKQQHHFVFVDHHCCHRLFKYKKKIKKIIFPFLFCYFFLFLCKHMTSRCLTWYKRYIV